MATWTKSAPTLPPQGTVYLLHFENPVGNERHTARHYIGFTTRTPEIRLREHTNGRGCPLVAHAHRAGRVEIVRTWEGTRALERRLKNRKNHGHLCPCCCGDDAFNRAN